MSTTIKAAVAQTLIQNAKDWVSITDPTATRRLRELRAEGWQIRTRRNPQTPTQFEYMLAKVPAKKVIAQYV